MAIIKKTTKLAKAAVEVKSIDDLSKDLANLQNDLIEAKRGHKQGELVNTCSLKTTRKKIARLYTAIRAMQMTSEKESK